MENCCTEKRPLVSIITPNYNCGNFIALTIESVIAQTFTDWEMLIQDDCSTDNSYEIALEYAKKEGFDSLTVFENGKKKTISL